MDYDDAIKHFVANEFNLDVTNIKAVSTSLDTDNYGYCETCSYDVAEVVFYVEFFDKASRSRFTIDDTSFTSFLQSLISIATKMG